MTFDDSLYVQNHGAKPRGRGAWAFMDAKWMTGIELPLDYLQHIVTVRDKTFSEAKAWVRKDVLKAAQNGFIKKPRRMLVLP